MLQDLLTLNRAVQTWKRDSTLRSFIVHTKSHTYYFGSIDQVRHKIKQIVRSRKANRAR